GEETLATRLPTNTRSERSSLSDASVASTLPSRTETDMERERVTTASAASAPARRAASTRCATRSLNPRVSSESFIYQLIRLAGIRDYCRPPGRVNDSPGRPVSFMVLAASVQWQRQPRLASGRIRVGSL